MYTKVGKVVQHIILPYAIHIGSPVVGISEPLVGSHKAQSPYILTGLVFPECQGININPELISST